MSGHRYEMRVLAPARQSIASKSVAVTVRKLARVPRLHGCRRVKFEIAGDGQARIQKNGVLAHSCPLSYVEHRQITVTGTMESTDRVKNRPNLEYTIACHARQPRRSQMCGGAVALVHYQQPYRANEVAQRAVMRHNFRKLVRFSCLPQVLSCGQIEILENS